MNQIGNQEWTSSEREKARSVITKFESNSCSNNDINDNDNEKHNIYCELHSWFPWKTMQQVEDLYIDLVVDMLMMPCEETYDGAIGEHGIVNTIDGLVNENFWVHEKASMDGMDFLFGNPIHVMSLMGKEKVPVVEKNKVGVLENRMTIHQPMDPPYTRRFWTPEEHRLFLGGLWAFGRGKWKSISKYFITTRTPVQIASHAQKYFKKLESKELRNQCCSINDVEVDDVDQWKMNNSSGAQQAPAFANADSHNPELRPANSIEHILQHPHLDVMSLMDTKEVPVGVLDNKMHIHQPMDAPYTRRFWTPEEHRLFLCGLCAFGHGKWKSISKYFVTTRTPVQIASHAQKYFKKLESKELRNQRYSINDVEVDDVNQWKMNNSSSAQQAPAFANADNHNPSFGLQTPASTFFPTNDIAQNQMMFPVADLMEGAENLFSYQ